jgi:hypothetical protein
VCDDWCTSCPTQEVEYRLSGFIPTYKQTNQLPKKERFKRRKEIYIQSETDMKKNEK